MGRGSPSPGGHLSPATTAEAKEPRATAELRDSSESRQQGTSEHVQSALLPPESLRLRSSTHLLEIIPIRVCLNRLLRKYAYNRTVSLVSKKSGPGRKGG